MDILRPKYDLYCHGCGATARASRTYTCVACGEPMSVRCLATPDLALFDAPARSMWTYFDLLPLDSRDNVVSLGEGATPLVEAPSLGETLGIGRLLLKNEMGNPTGSFKDRQVSAGISHAKETGADTVAVVSSGNVACAASAYAARAGMRAVLLMHGHAAPGKVLQAAVYGGKVVQVDTPSAAAVFDLCIEACGKFGWRHLSTAGMYEPFNVEGSKTIAYELYQQTGGDLPDWIVVPVGGGGLLGGVWRGFLDLQRLGCIERLPRLAGIQASGCAPLIMAIDKGMGYLETLEHPWPNPKTIAGGIADDILFDGHTALPAIRTSDGRAIAVTDEEIIEAQRALASSEGLFCEPTAGVVIAALRHLPDVGQDTRVCCLLTGNGIKDIGAFEPYVERPARIGASLGELEKAVGSA